MGVWLQDVLERGGYDIIENPEDAKWLLSQKDEFLSLCGRAEECIEDYNEYKDFVEMQEDEFNNFNNPSWEEWRKEKYAK